nr:retrovirus-related Pol polyprotein from transposon TNT 1-94 [Tanacetum cinerariifolium]
CYNYNEKGHYACDCQKPKVRDAKYFREQMLLAMKDEAGSHLSNEENYFMLDNAYGGESLDKLTTFVMLMARLQPIAETTDTVPLDDDKASLQKIDMLSKKPNKIYDPFLKARLGYQNPECLKKAIATQPKMYDGDMLHSEKLIINSTDSEETLEDAKESQNKMIQVNYDKINALYETFVPQQEISAEQTYFSIPSTSNHSSESKDVPSESPVLKMPNESRLLKMMDKLERENIKLEFHKIFNSIKITRAQHQKEVDELIQCVTQKTYAYGDVRAKNQDLLMTISELKSKINTIKKGMNVNTKFDSSETLGKGVYVTPFNKQIADKAMNALNSKVNLDRLELVTSQSTSKPEQGVGSSHSVRRSTSKDIKSKNSILKNTKSSSTYHRRLSHLNFGTINQLTSNDLVDGLPKLKYTKDHLCSACEQGKSKKASLPPKLVPSTESKLELLHMDSCGPIRVTSINGKIYILMIVDDYSRYTWNRSIVHTRHNKTPYEVIRGIKPNIQYFHVFGSLCYPANDRDDLRKMKPKADIEYYEPSSQEVSDDFAINTPDNDHTSSSSSIVVDQDDAPLVVSSSDEQVSTIPNFPVMNEVANEFVQEDVADFYANMFHNAP